MSGGCRLNDFRSARSGHFSHTSQTSRKFSLKETIRRQQGKYNGKSQLPKLRILPCLVQTSANWPTAGTKVTRSVSEGRYVLAYASGYYGEAISCRSPYGCEAGSSAAETS